MSRATAKDKDKPVVVSEDKPVVNVEGESGGDAEEVKAGPMSSKQFVKLLKKEIDGYIPEAVYAAFMRITKPVDTEGSYREIWKTTFKRR